MKTIKILLIAGIFSFSCKGQTVYKNDSVLVNNFVSYVKSCLERNADVTDSAHLKFILLHYLFVDRRLDSAQGHLLPHELTDEQLNSLKKQLHAFSEFLQNDNLYDHFDVMPASKLSDTYIYNHLTAFQKENTVAFFDKRSQHIGCYILFMPSMERVLSTPRIWSWTLTFQYGKYMFRSVTGEDGYEYIFRPEKKN